MVVKILTFAVLGRNTLGHLNRKEEQSSGCYVRFSYGNSRRIFPDLSENGTPVPLGI